MSFLSFRLRYAFIDKFRCFVVIMNFSTLPCFLKLVKSRMKKRKNKTKQSKKQTLPLVPHFGFPSLTGRDVPFISIPLLSTQKQLRPLHCIGSKVPSLLHLGIILFVWGFLAYLLYILWHELRWSANDELKKSWEHLYRLASYRTNLNILFAHSSLVCRTCLPEALLILHAGTCHVGDSVVFIVNRHLD